MMARNMPVPLGQSLRKDKRALVVALFVTYVVLLTWIVVWKLEVPFVGAGGLRHIKLVPFAASGENTASEPLEIVVNFLLFVPFGVYLALLAPVWSFWTRAGAIVGASLILETAQYALAVGSSDVTDIVVNTVGGLTGLALLARAGRRLQARTTAAVTRICLIGTVLVGLACAAFFASPLHYGQRDVVPAHSTR